MGSREWIKEYLLSYEGYPQAPPENSLLSRLVAVFNLNLLPDTNVVFPIITGNFYLEGDGFNVWPVKAKAEYLTFVGEWLKDQTGKDYGFYPYGEVVASDLFYAQKAEEAPAIAGAIHNPWLDHEPFAYAGGQSYVTVSFSTGRATYPFYGSPSDRYDMVQPLVGNLKPQLELVYSWLYTYLHTDFLHSLEPPRVISLWADVKAYPVVWNITEGKYTRFVKSPGQTAIIKISLKKGISLEDSTVFVIADDNGEFRLHGLTSRNKIGRAHV